MSVQPTANLTAAFAPELERQIAASVPGMAYFAATGPLGARCKDCIFYGYPRVFHDKAGNVVKTVFKRNRCGKFHDLRNRHGGPIPPGTESRKYFEPTSP